MNKYIRKLNNKQYELHLEKREIDDLLFNPFNTRIFDLIKSQPELKKIEDNFDLESLKKVQKLILEKLKNNLLLNENKDIINSIKEDNVQNKMIILENGILLSGNNRLSIIKNLIEKNEWNHPTNIEVFVIKENFTKEEIIIAELEIQNIQSKQLAYDVINNIRRAKDLIEKGIDVKRTLQLTNQSNSSKIYIYNFNSSLDDLSKFYQVPNIIEKIGNLKIYSWIDYYTNIINNVNLRSNRILINNIKNIMYLLVIFSSERIAFLDFRFIIANILKYERNERDDEISKLSLKIKNILNPMANELILAFKNGDDLKDFKKTNKFELSNANFKIKNHFELLSSNIKIVKRKVAKNVFDIKIDGVEKSEKNIIEAMKLIEKLNKWLEN